MTDLSQWTPGAALFLARRQGIEGWPQHLTDDHWRVIDFMRSYYAATGNAPSLRYTCKALGLTKRQFSRLFPGGLMTARRISGLPGPRRVASKRELSMAQQLLAGNWWERLTQPDLRDHRTGRLSHVPPTLGILGRSSKRDRTAAGPLPLETGASDASDLASPAGGLSGVRP